MKHPAIFVLLSCLLLFTHCEANKHPETLPREFKAKVTSIRDGDTIETLYNNKTIRIRFDHVDCPEIKNGQPYGKAAKKYTSNLCFGQQVTVMHNGKYDRYKRLIAVIINAQGVNVNKELVKAGMAWHFRRYSTDREYDHLEAEARNNRRGLWQENNPTPPWDWRKKGKNKN